MAYSSHFMMMICHQYVQITGLGHHLGLGPRQEPARAVARAWQWIEQQHQLTMSVMLGLLLHLYATWGSGGITCVGVVKLLHWVLGMHS